MLQDKVYDVIYRGKDDLADSALLVGAKLQHRVPSLVNPIHKHHRRAPEDL